MICIFAPLDFWSSWVLLFFWIATPIWVGNMDWTPSTLESKIYEAVSWAPKDSIEQHSLVKDVRPGRALLPGFWFLDSLGGFTP